MLAGRPAFRHCLSRSPINPRNAQEVPVRKAERASTHPSMEHSIPARILLVDDNPVVLFKVAHVLSGAGYTVIEAKTGSEGLALARSEHPDLILLDVRLPDINGIEVCRRLKASPETSRLFVVMLSEKETSAESQAGGLEAGADSYIARPIENRELIARSQAMLRIQQAESALRVAQAELEQRVAERTAELSQANAALRAMSLRLVEVQEKERRFVAHELHDQLGQTLTGLKLVLEMSLKPTNPSQAESFAEALRLIDDLMERIRRLSVDLRPHMLDDLGLLPALEWHFRRFGKQTGIQVQLKRTATFNRLPPPIETAAYRIVQEALTNVARHSGAKEADVRLWAGDERLRVQVEDRGKGFQPEQALAARNSTGLAGMRERAEDHHVVRQGFKALLEAQSDFRLIGEAADGLTAVELVEKHHPNILVLDLMIPRLHGLEVIRRVHKSAPHTRVIVLSMHPDEPYVMEALRNGASGYVLKDSTAAELVQAVRTVMAGRRHLSPALEERALTGYVERPGQSDLDVYETLTNRERLVLQLAAEGKTSAEIGKELFISPRTVETHRANLMRKLSLRSQTDLVRFAIRKGIIPA